MNENIVPQSEPEVKCSYDGCGEETFRDGLCWGHFVAEKIADWDAQDAERRVALEGVGYVFGDYDPILDLSWHGYPVEEVCR